MNEELTHYGVKGMKWGVRKQEVKEDNKKAFELGRDATILGRAREHSLKRYTKALNKTTDAYKKDPNLLRKSTNKKFRNLGVEKLAYESIESGYQNKKKEMEQHSKSLVKKYGQENVKKIAYKTVTDKETGKTREIPNERVTSGEEWIASALITAGSTAAMLNGLLPVGVISTPAGADSRGKKLYNMRRYEADLYLNRT